MGILSLLTVSDAIYGLQQSWINCISEIRRFTGLEPCKTLDYRALEEADPGYRNAEEIHWQTIKQSGPLIFSFCPLLLMLDAQPGSTDYAWNRNEGVSRATMTGPAVGPSYRVAYARESGRSRGGQSMLRLAGHKVPGEAVVLDASRFGPGYVCPFFLCC